MKNSYIDIHTHKVRDNIRSILCYSLGIDATPPADVAFSAGIHPWNAEDCEFEGAQAYLKSAPVVAIGEIGLDYARGIDRERQMEVFIAQLKIAEERNLPVIIHCVRAYMEVLNILRDYKLKAVVFHGYIGSQEQTATILGRDYYISLGEVSLQSNKTIESLKNTPLDRLFLETDMSDITIEENYAQAANILQIPRLLLIDAVAENYKKVFE